jgi:hypothetical protein
MSYSNTNLVIGPRWEPEPKTDWPTERRSQNNLNLNLSLALKYGHESRGTRPCVETGYNTSTVAASRKMRRKGNPVPEGVTGPPCSWGYKYGDLALQLGESQVRE